MSYEISVAPTGVVVPLSELKDHLRYLSADSDTEITAMHDAAVELVESDLRRQLLTATWNLYLPRFEGTIRIEKSPVVSVSAITYVDSAGVTQTLAASNYQVDVKSEPAKIDRAFEMSWPIAKRVQNAVTITFVAGYGASVDVPVSIKQAIKLIVESMFYGRDMDSIQPVIDSLLMRHRYDI